MAKVRKQNQQLELPVLVSIGRAGSPASSNLNRVEGKPSRVANNSMRLEASPEDKAIYRSISNNYFRECKD